MHSPAIFHLPLAVPFWIIFFLAFVREAKVVRPALAAKASTQDEGTFRALMIGSPLAVFVAGAAAYLPWFTIPGATAPAVAGMALMAAGAVLRRYCFYALGESFTGVVTVRKDQEVVQTGLYRFIRHPSYTAAFLMFTGVGLAMQSWLSLGLLFFAHCYLYGRRVAAEERALVATLGSSYTDYMRRTKRFIPFII
ncbi:MAG TPA: isoprenylcysteine carboxylmethyltransferase family protein [Candidatus Binataceae bacterium]|nr:isoprenylcysteine carboxylmethyltransferase family protein [Candidatus Binataceae bacterium]